MDKESRIEYLDIAKGIAIISVFVGHYIQFFIGQDSIIFNVFYSFHMPLFFMISGYFIKRESSHKDIIRKKIKRLLVPYLCTGMLYAILNTLRIIFKERNLDSAFTSFIKVLYGVMYGTGTGEGSYYISLSGDIGHIYEEAGMLWFLLAILWGSIIVHFCINRKYSGLYIIVITLIGYISSKYIWLPFSLQTAMNATIYIYIGYIAKKYQLLDKIKANIKNYVLILVFLVLWGFCICEGQCLMYCNEYKNGIIDFCGAVAASYVIICVCKFFDSKKIQLNVIKWFGRNSLLTLCIHYLDAQICYFIIHRILDILGNKVSILAEEMPLFLLTILLELVLYAAIATVLKKINVIRKIYG